MDNYPWKQGKAWHYRTATIAKIFPENVSILDLGGGYQHLKRYLPNGSVYASIDIFPCTPDTIVADFNKGEFPSFPTTFHFVVCQGIIEYIRNPQIFLTKIRKYGKILVITYKEKSEAPIWRNDMPFEEFRKLLKKTRWEIVMERELKNELLFYCKAK